VTAAFLQHTYRAKSCCQKGFKLKAEHCQCGESAVAAKNCLFRDDDIGRAAHRTFECTGTELNSRMRKVPLAQSSFIFHLVWFNLAGIYLGLALEGHVGEVDTIE
jgi:hypothetical protein